MNLAGVGPLLLTGYGGALLRGVSFNQLRFADSGEPTIPATRYGQPGPRLRSHYVPTDTTLIRMQMPC